VNKYPQESFDAFKVTFNPPIEPQGQLAVFCRTSSLSITLKWTIGCPWHSYLLMVTYNLERLRANKKTLTDYKDLLF